LSKTKNNSIVRSGTENYELRINLIMIEKEKHINYSAADIEKYWKGQLPSAEMHAMEKAALEDPFLADALEGYQARSSEWGAGSRESIANDTNILQQRLAERVTEKKVAPLVKLGWWKIAAAFIVLVAGVWAYTAINNKNKNTSLAKKDLIKKTPAVPIQDSIAALSKTNDALKDVAVTERKQSTSANSSKKEIAPIATQKETKKELSASSAVVADSNALVRQEDAKKTEERTETKSNNISIAKRASKPATDKTVQAELSGTVKGVSTENDDKTGPNGRRTVAINDVNTFNGKIVDQLNQPVPNASIQIPNLNVATQTDRKGNFSFKAPDTVLSVSVASAGFLTQNIKLQKAEGFSNQITLKPNAAGLNEVVVTGYAAKEKKFLSRAKGVTIKILDAEPIISWDAYADYLEKNKQAPEELKDTHGDVIVSFIVDANNRLKSFSIEKSLDEELDAEAIRLIKEGPAWKLLKGKILIPDYTPVFLHFHISTSPYFHIYCLFLRSKTIIYETRFACNEFRLRSTHWLCPTIKNPCPQSRSNH
jgi:hypothetical protein